MNLETFLTIAAIAWPVAVWAVRYPDSVLRMIWREGHTLTWHIETAVIGGVSAVLVIASGGGALQWMAWAGGMAGHGSSSVGRRMYEAQARAAAGGSKPDVHCWRAQREYSYTGRMWFAGVNLLLGWYGALASIALGVLYDQWRELYTRRRARQAAIVAMPDAETVDLGQLITKLGPEGAADALKRWMDAPMGTFSSRRRATTARGLTVDEVIAHLRELADQEEQAAAAVLMAAESERQPNESEQHDHAAAVLRAAAGDIERRAARP